MSTSLVQVSTPSQVAVGRLLSGASIVGAATGGLSIAILSWPYLAQAAWHPGLVLVPIVLASLIGAAVGLAGMVVAVLGYKLTVGLSRKPWIASAVGGVMTGSFVGATLHVVIAPVLLWNSFASGVLGGLASAIAVGFTLGFSVRRASLRSVEARHQP